MRSKAMGRVVVAGLMTILAAAPLEGCRPRGLGSLARAASRANRTYGNTPAAEKMPPLRLSPLTKDVKQTIAESREWFDRIKERYNETGSLEQDPAMITRLIQAWKNDADGIEKPKTIRMSQALGIAMGDEIARRFNIQWTMVEGSSWGLASTNGLFAVFPDDLMDDWVCGRSTPAYKATLEEIRVALASPGEEPKWMRGLDVPKTWAPADEEEP